MIIKITTPENKTYTLSEGLYAIDGTWLFEDNELTGRLNIALLSDCEVEIEPEEVEIDFDRYLKNQILKSLNNPNSKESAEIGKIIDKYFKTEIVAKLLTDVLYDKFGKDKVSKLFK